MNNRNMVWKPQERFSRRDFLSLCGISLAGLFLPGKLIDTFGKALIDNEPYELLGRITQSGYELYETPTARGEVIKRMPKDSLWRITGVTLSEEDDAPNRIWYELDGRGYAHSRWIQPVSRQFNDANKEIPKKGCLGEITVPYVDAYNSMGEDRSIVYRFYYATTYWVLARIVDDHRSVWYKLLDDRNHAVYYVPAYYVHLVDDSELAPLSPEVSPEDKKIIVDLETQVLTAYEKDKIVFMSRISSGVRLKEGGFATPRGHYRTTRKRPCRHMANPPNDYGGGFDLPGVPWVSYFTSNGIAFHGAYWHNNFGVPHSHGCINMTPQAANWVYRWTTPTVPPEDYFYADENGTRVIVQ